MTKTLKNGPKHKTRKYKCPPFQGICMLTYYNYYSCCKIETLFYH